MKWEGLRRKLWRWLWEIKTLGNAKSRCGDVDNLVMHATICVGVGSVVGGVDVGCGGRQDDEWVRRRSA